MTSHEQALTVRQTGGENLELPTILILDPSEFRRTCVMASLSSHGFSQIAHFDGVGDVPEGEQHDLVVYFFENSHDEATEFAAELAQVKELAPDAKIVVIVDEPEEFLEQPAGPGGSVHSVLPADMEPELLRASFCLIHHGYGLYPLGESGRPPRPFMLSKTSGALNLGMLEGHPLLAKITPRQRQVLESLLLGQSNKEIAKRLSISESTVKTHVHFIMRILGAANRTQIVLKFAQQSDGQPHEAGQLS